MQNQFAQHPPYIPVLKWQRGEQRAISNLFPVAKERVWPCIDVRMPQQHQNFLASFKKSWDRSALIDYADPSGFLSSWRRNAYAEMLGAGKATNFPFVPVLNPLDPLIEKDAELLELAKAYGRLAFRARIENMTVPPSLHAACAKLIRSLLPYTGYIQLVIDHRVTPAARDDATYKQFLNDLAALKALGFWAVSFISGAYPDLLPNGTTHTPSRSDWLLWEKLHGLKPDLLLGFGDYGILSPNWTEEVLVRRPNVSIRYADSHQWIIIKGTAKTSAESIAISKVLTVIHKGLFRGESFSYGDRLIADRCNDSLLDKHKKCGNEMHVSEGWNHHMSLVVQEQYI